MSEGSGLAVARPLSAVDGIVVVACKGKTNISTSVFCVLVYDACYTVKNKMLQNFVRRHSV